MNRKTFTTLQKLWEQNESQPFVAVSENGTIVNIVGCHNEKVFGWVGNEENVKTFDANRDHWVLYTEAELTPHWPAIKKIDGYENHKNYAAGYSLSTTLYASEELARRNNGRRFIRLAKEMEPIMLMPSAHERKILERD